MATKKPKGAPSAAALSQDSGTVIPRMSLKEQGFVGLKTTNHTIWEEANRAFQYPAFIKTVNEMRNNPTVGAAMNVYRMFISRVNWKVEPPVNASDIDTERANIIEGMMHDMDHTWRAFIEEVIPYLEYGFDIHEKVLRRRLKKNGSKFDDGLVGIKKLAPRNPDTIIGWVFSEDGADLVQVQQTIQNLENGYRFANRLDDQGRIPIDREKFLLFTASANKGNPQGNSIYKNIYLAYKQLTLLQDNELVGVAKDIQGILKICLPPEYLDPNASADKKAVATAFQGIIDNYNSGTQRGLLVPLIIDPESKQPLFTYDLMEQRGQAKYDTEAIIKRLQTDILSALSVDILKLGSDGTGSFSLASAKASVLAIAIDYRLREIQEVLNADLMRTIYEMNGWQTDNMAKFCYEDIEDIDMESAGKFIQQVFSSGAIEMDRPAMNRVRSIFGIPEKPDDEPVDKERLSTHMSNVQSSAGQGMAPGTNGNGTSKNSAGSKDASAANANNK